MYATFADGMRLTTADGGRLLFQTSGQHDPADGPPQVSVDCLAAVSAAPPGGNEDMDVWALTTAIVDAEGRLWQRTRIHDEGIVLAAARTGAKTGDMKMDQQSMV
jgi:hypothetical protein